MATKQPDDTSWRALNVKDVVPYLQPLNIKVLEQFDIATCGELADVDPEKLLSYRGFGKTRLDSLYACVREELRSMGYTMFGVIPVEDTPAPAPEPVDLSKYVLRSTVEREYILRRTAERMVEDAHLSKTTDAKREFIEAFIMHRASTVTGELNGMTVAYEAGRAWMKMEELCSGGAA